MADIRLPDIKASVKVDSKGVDDGLNRIQASTRNAGAGFTGLQKSASYAIDGLSTSLTAGLGPASGQAKAALDRIGASAVSSGAMLGTAVGGGALLAGAALGKFALDGARQLVALDAEIRNFQRGSGASAEEASRFVAVLDDLGVSSETAASALFKLGKNVSADAGQNLARYGIEVQRAKDGTVSLTETLLNVADAYQRQTDPAKRAELAFAAFGKQGQALVPVLEQGRAGLQAFFDGVKDGEMRTQAQIDKSRKFELALDDLSDTFRELKFAAGDSLIPFLTGLANAGVKVIEFSRSLDSLLDKMLKATGEGAGRPFAGHLEVLEKLKAKSDSAKGAQNEMGATVKETAARHLEAAAAGEEQARALDRLHAATVSSVSSGVAYQSSLLSLKEAINDADESTAAYTAAVDANGASSKEAQAAQRELERANLGVEQAAVAAATASVKLAEDTAAAGGQALTAQQKADLFRNELISLANQASGPTREAIMALAQEVVGIPNRTVYVDADTSAAQAAIASLERRLASISAGASSTAGPQQFAEGLEVGPVRGRPGQAVPVIAHAGEYIVTPAQLADLRNSPAPMAYSPGPGPTTTTGPAEHGHDIYLDGQKVGRAVAPAVARGMAETRRSRS